MYWAVIIVPGWAIVDFSEDIFHHLNPTFYRWFIHQIGKLWFSLSVCRDFVVRILFFFAKVSSKRKLWNSVLCIHTKSDNKNSLLDTQKKLYQINITIWCVEAYSSIDVNFFRWQSNVLPLNQLSSIENRISTALRSYNAISNRIAQRKETKIGNTFHATTEQDKYTHKNTSYSFGLCNECCKNKQRAVR